MTDEPELVTAARLAARDSVNALDRPDEDIIPALVLKRPGDLKILSFEVIDDAHGSLADYIMALTACSQATEVALIVTAWMIDNPSTEDMNSGIRPSQHPDRVETVVLAYSAGDGCQVWTARLTRHENRPPDMGLWESCPAGGMFATALSNGLKMAAAAPNVPGLTDLLDGIRDEESLVASAAVLLETIREVRCGKNK